MRAFSKWNVKEVILTTFIAILTGIIFSAFDWIYELLYAPLAGTGWAPIMGEAMNGLWFMAGPLAIMITKLPGSGVFAEVLGGLIEMLIGGAFGTSNLIDGFLQGLGAEVAFGIFKYKKINFRILLYSSIFITLFSFAGSLFTSSYIKLRLPVLLIYLLVRFISSLVFSSGLNWSIWRLFLRSKTIKTNF